MHPGEPPPAEDAVGTREGEDGNEHMECHDSTHPQDCEGSDVHGFP